MNSCYLDLAYLPLYNELKLSKIALKNVNKKGLISLTLEDENNLEDIVKTNKLKIGWLDFDFNYNYDSDFPYDKVVNLVKRFSLNQVILTLPKINDFELDKSEFKEAVINIIKTFRQNRIKVVFQIDYKEDSAIIAYLISEIKEISFVFDSKACFQSDKSISTYYRLLRSKIEIFIVSDIDEKKEATLLGYGKAQLKDMALRLKHDNFKGDILYQFNLDDYLENRNKLYKKRLPFMKGKSFNSHLFIEEKLELTKTDTITYEDLFIKQYNIFSYLFK